MDNQEVVGVIQKDGDKYCLMFSDGRKECFPSRKQAQERERQVSFFKNRGKASRGDECAAMAHLGIHSSYEPETSNESLYFVVEGDEPLAFLAKDDGEGVKVFPLDETYEDYDSYKEIVEECFLAMTQARQINLSESVVGAQLVSGGHAHTVTLDENGMGWTDADDTGHQHFVDMSSSNGQDFVSFAPVEVDGIKISHTHLIVVNSKG